MRKRTHAWILVPVLVCLGVMVYSQGQAGFIEIIGLDPRSAAMGGAATAVADTPSAWYYNPAGLAQIRGGWQELGLSQIAFIKLEQRNPEDGTSSRSTTPTTYNIHMPGCDNYGLKNITIALGGGANFGGDTYWSDTQGDIRYTAYETMTIINTLAPAIGYRVNSWLMVGAGLEILALNKATTFNKIGDGYFGAAVRDQIIKTLGIPPDRSKQVGDFLKAIGIDSENGKDDGKIEFYTDKEFPTGLQPTNDMDIDMRHFSYNLGILLLPTDRLRIGITYREEIRLTFEGPLHFILEEDAKAIVNNNPLLVALNGPIQDEATRWRMDTILPRELVVGLAYQFTDRLLVATDFQWTNWSSAWDRQTVYLEGNGIQGLTELPVNRDFRDTFSFRIGAEYRIWKGLRCQAGYWYDPTPIPNHTIDGTTMDANRHTFSFGLGYYGLFNGLLDVSGVFQYLDFEKRRIEVGESENLGGFKRYESFYNDFPLELGGYAMSVGIVLGVHY